MIRHDWPRLFNNELRQFAKNLIFRSHLMKKAVLKKMRTL